MKHRIFKARFFLLSGFVSLLVTGCLPPPTRKHAPPVAKNVRFKGVYQPPVTGMKLLSPFGPRHGSFHTGIDVRGSGAHGKTVKAAMAGTVISAGSMRGYGNIVTLRHANGSQTRYAHLKSFSIKAGQSLKAGDPIGIVGTTGRTTGPHLHFEILTSDGKFVDPTSYIFR